MTTTDPQPDDAEREANGATDDPHDDKLGENDEGAPGRSLIDEDADAVEPNEPA